MEGGTRAGFIFVFLARRHSRARSARKLSVFFYLGFHSALRIAVSALRFLARFARALKNKPC